MPVLVRNINSTLEDGLAANEVILMLKIFIPGQQILSNFLSVPLTRFSGRFCVSQLTVSIADTSEKLMLTSHSCSCELIHFSTNLTFSLGLSQEAIGQSSTPCSDYMVH